MWFFNYDFLTKHNDDDNFPKAAKKEDKKKKVKTAFCKHCEGNGLVRDMTTGNWYTCSKCEP